MKNPFSTSKVASVALNLLETPPSLKKNNVTMPLLNLLPLNLKRVPKPHH